MNRTEKAAEIESLKSRFQSSLFTILADYKGLSVASITDLRRRLRKGDATLKVVKNRLAKIAAKDTPVEALSAHFVGTTAVAMSMADPTVTAKALTGFAKENEKLVIKAALFEGKPLTIKEITALASLPSREELIAKMLGSMQAPARNLVSVLAQIPRQLVTVLSAIKDQKTTQQ